MFAEYSSLAAEIASQEVRARFARCEIGAIYLWPMLIVMQTQFSLVHKILICFSIQVLTIRHGCQLGELTNQIFEISILSIPCMLQLVELIINYLLISGINH